MARSRHSIEQKLSALRMIEEDTYAWKEIEEPITSLRMPSGCGK